MAACDEIVTITGSAIPIRQHVHKLVARLYSRSDPSYLRRIQHLQNVIDLITRMLQPRLVGFTRGLHLAVVHEYCGEYYYSDVGSMNLDIVGRTFVASQFVTDSTNATIEIVASKSPDLPSNACLVVGGRKMQKHSVDSWAYAYLGGKVYSCHDWVLFA